MAPRTYLKRRQHAWALARNIPVVDGYVTDLNQNLFQPLGPEAHAEFAAGDGHELGHAGQPGHMFALHSSSAATVNLFHYWKANGQVAAIAGACRLPTPGAAEIRFEAQHEIHPLLERPANLDVEIRYAERGLLKVSAVECKFSEPYSGRRHEGLRPRYLDADLAVLWDGLPNCLALAQAISPDDHHFTRLHAAQLLKHILGLKASFGLGGFRLLYLWNNVPGPEAVEHAQEVQEFAGNATADGVAFQSLTYQELILRLVRYERAQHPAYVDYLVGRYL